LIRGTFTRRIISSRTLSWRVRTEPKKFYLTETELRKGGEEGGKICCASRQNAKIYVTPRISFVAWDYEELQKPKFRGRRGRTTLAVEKKGDSLAPVLETNPGRRTTARAHYETGGNGAIEREQEKEHSGNFSGGLISTRKSLSTKGGCRKKREVLLW